MHTRKLLKNRNHKVNLNKWDYILTGIIASLSFGVLGGAFQLVRIISIIMFIPNLIILINNRIPKAYLQYLLICFMWLAVGYILLDQAILKKESQIDFLYLPIHFNIILSILLAGRFARRPYDSMLNGWLIFFLATSIIGIFEVFTGIHMPTNSIQSTVSESGLKLNGVENKKYAAAFFNNYNEFMTAMSFGFPYLFCSSLFYKKIKKQLFIWILIFTVFIIVVVTASRGAILSFAISIIITLYYSRNFKFQHKETLYKYIFIIGLIGIILFAGFLFSEISNRLDRVEATEDVGRIMLYEGIWQYFERNNYIGLGPYGIQSRLNYAPHNMWLELLCQYGLFVFIPISIIMLYSIIKIFKQSKNNLSIRCCINIYFITLPIITIINSAYLDFSFLWISTGSILLLARILDTKKQVLSRKARLVA